MKPSFSQKHFGRYKEHFQLLGDPNFDPDWWVTQDPTIPRADAIIGAPLVREEIKPMADFSKPEDFPEEVQAIIESVSNQSFFERLLS
jgi:hypothetical protein